MHSFFCVKCTILWLLNRSLTKLFHLLLLCSVTPLIYIIKASRRFASEKLSMWNSNIKKALICISSNFAHLIQLKAIKQRRKKTLQYRKQQTWTTCWTENISQMSFSLIFSIQYCNNARRKCIIEVPPRGTNSLWCLFIMAVIELNDKSILNWNLYLKQHD